MNVEMDFNGSGYYNFPIYENYGQSYSPNSVGSFTGNLFVSSNFYEHLFRTLGERRIRAEHFPIIQQQHPFLWKQAKNF